MKLQLEKGSIATPYEPYTESTQYITAKDDEGKIVELRSLSSETKDEIRVADNKLIKRVSDEVVLDGSENWTYSGSTEQIDVYNVANWPSVFNCVEITSYKNQDAIVATSKKNKITIESSWNVKAWSEDADIGIHTYNNYLHIIAKKHLGLTTTAMLKQYLGQYPITLTYQLAQEQVIPVQVSGTLVGFPSGTVYWEQIVPDAGLYSDGITVLHQDLPIKSIEKISKIDYETGLETILDASKAVIASDKLSFTHPDLSEGDIVFFEYEYDVESTDGEAEVEFYDSRYVVKDSATGKFYKWSITVTNGTPSIQLTEV